MSAQLNRALCCCVWLSVSDHSLTNRGRGITRYVMRVIARLVAFFHQPKPRTLSHVDKFQLGSFLLYPSDFSEYLLASEKCPSTLRIPRTGTKHNSKNLTY